MLYVNITKKVNFFNVTSEQNRRLSIPFDSGGMIATIYANDRFKEQSKAAGPQNKQFVINLHKWALHNYEVMRLYKSQTLVIYSILQRNIK